MQNADIEFRLFPLNQYKQLVTVQENAIEQKKKKMPYLLTYHYSSCKLDKRPSKRSPLQMRKFGHWHNGIMYLYLMKIAH